MIIREDNVVQLLGSNWHVVSFWNCHKTAPPFSNIRLLLSPTPPPLAPSIIPCPAPNHALSIQNQIPFYILWKYHSDNSLLERIIWKHLLFSFIIYLNLSENIFLSIHTSSGIHIRIGKPQIKVIFSDRTT